jgi:hypothetical protein
MGIISYMESHDEERLMFKNLQYGNTSNAAHNVRQLPIALQRMQAAGAMFFTVPGPKMLWQFGELGYDVSINANEQGVLGSGDQFRTSRKPIRWEYRNNPDRYQLYKVWSELMKLRESDPIFRSINTEVYYNNGAVRTFRYKRGDDHVIVIANFGVTTATGLPGYPVTGTWYDWASGNEFQVSSLQQDATVAPGAFHIYSTKRFPKPDLGTTVSNERELAEAPATFRLNAAYPNPFNPTTNISFEMGRAGQVTIEIVDLLGRNVATLARNSKYGSGTHTIQWNAAGLGSGMYLIRMEAAGRTFVQKVTLLK